MATEIEKLENLRGRAWELCNADTKQLAEPDPAHGYIVAASWSPYAGMGLLWDG